MKNQFKSFISIIFLLSLVAGGYVYAQTVGTWTVPASGCVPPDCNIATPLNVSVEPQAKEGSLSLGATSMPTAGSVLDTNGKAILGALAVPGDTALMGKVIISGGSPSNGKVLTATGADGTATWQTLSGSSGGGGFSNFQVFDASGTFTVLPGVSKVMVEVWGGGGRGSHVAGTSPSGFGGGGGGYGKGIYTVTPGDITVTVGAGDSTGIGGGTSSFGSFISATGGTVGSSSGSVGGTSNAPFKVDGQDGSHAGAGGSAYGDVSSDISGEGTLWLGCDYHITGRGGDGIAEMNGNTPFYYDCSGSAGRVVVWY